ncbi:MAG TPA: penicillin-binding protein 2 [Alphaproteobacteria bacterium]|nr:penicillin-binding protein 2 [Alphaproteobacteria bacterium]
MTPPETTVHHLEGIRKQALEMGRNRLLVTGALFALAFFAIAFRLVDLSLFSTAEPAFAGVSSSPPPITGRADIVDRNGIILATSLPTRSLYANPRDIIDVEDAARRLRRALPRLNREEVLIKLKSKSAFVWLKRDLTPKQQFAVNGQGIPGLAFRREERRVYPQLRAAAQVIGLTDVDGVGIAGIERRFDQSLKGGGPALVLSIDIRVQAVMRRELLAAMTEFRAIGAAGVVLDVRTGEVLALVSLPDFDPNRPRSSRGDAGFNRASKGVYEMGSTFKLFTAAMALDSGTVTLKDGYDASKPIRVARFTISDYHGKNRWLSIPEIIIYSSNIGAARMALDVGTDLQRAYLGRFGLLSPSSVELPEIGIPLMPPVWRDINTMTIGYGHGIAVSPLQLTNAVAALVNGGLYRPPTLLRQDAGKIAPGKRVLSEKTSEQIRYLMRQVVRRGTGRKAETAGYAVGGKTGTADKIVAGRYVNGALISSFIGAFPIAKPRYAILAMLDEPKGDKRTSNYATGGWVAAPVVRSVVRRLGPLLGLEPKMENSKLKPRVINAAVGKRENKSAAN